METTQTTLYIRLDYLQQNIQFLKSKLRKGTQFVAVVKANSYGNDAAKVAKYIEKNALADYFAVAYPVEGIALRAAGVSLPILVLHPQTTHFQEITTHQLEPTLYSLRMIAAWVAFAKEKALTYYPIHLKCNTGMNRLGLTKADWHQALQMLKDEKSSQVTTAYSHMVASEDKSERAKDFVTQQIAQFKAFQQMVLQELPYKVRFHMCNTSGILNFPQAHFDMVRSGIGMYGFGNDTDYQAHFKPITILKSIISQIHHIEKGSFVGYNFGFEAPKDTQVATIPVGHADGLHRIYGHGKGFVFIGEKKAPVLGNVCMDMLMVDVSDIPCKEGDQVIVYDGTHTAEELAQNAGSISYELITTLSQRIEKIFIE